MMILIPKSVSLSLVTHRLQRDGIGEKDCNEISNNPDNGCNESDRNIEDVKFRFPTFEEFCRIRTGNCNKYEFATSGKSAVSAFIEEPERFPVDEIYNADDEIGEFRSMRTVQGISNFYGKGNRKTDQAIEEIPGNDEFLDESIFSCSDSFLSDRDFQEKLADECDDDNPVLNSSSGLEENQRMFFPDKANTDFLSEKEFDSELDSDNNNDNTGNKLETLWEHQELIEQLKMELRKVRATGLPTIVEESESPRITTDDIKPWKIDDESLQHEDCIDEVNKLYKTYTETMRKFDILNYQKMYAMGFVQLKDPFKPTTQQKSPSSTLKSLISQNLGLFRPKKIESDNNPVKKLVSELQGDLEVVYMGQVCLSWEFLHWQYAKALDLWNSDPHGIHHYNEVAAEFQQFQVLVQRFVEDEPFQGPRVQSYVKIRCVLRNLLQVPAIREDNEKDTKKKAKRRSNRDEEYMITSEMLVKIVEESIRILWQFIRSDKDCNAEPNNGHKKIPHLHNPQDHKLLSQVKKTLQKKERKLKDIMRSEKCILRRFQQQATREKADEEVQHVSDQAALFFFAQVDIKLISRVLNMSKITRDQLLWCQNKLNRISFLNRKIHVNPAVAFLHFPCNN